MRPLQEQASTSRPRPCVTATEEHLVGAGPGHEGGEPLEKGIGGHGQPRCAVLPRGLELERHLARGEDEQAPVCEGRPEEVAAQVLESLAVDYRRAR